jgi:hypothetical protein
MPKITITLDDSIESLNQQRAELETKWQDPGGSDANVVERRKLLEFQMSRITGKRLVLAEIRAERDAASVEVAEISEAERKRMEKALDDLNDVIRADQSFNAILGHVTTMLAGATRVIDFVNAHPEAVEA